MSKPNPLLLLIAVILLGAFFRFYQIADIPPGLYPDEAANGTNALEALATGRFKIFYPENNGREGLFINIQAVAVKLLGAEPWALRAVSAVFGTSTILGIYLLAKELFRRSESKVMNHESGDTPHHDSKRKIQDSTLAALLSAFFLATSYWHVNFSRIGFRAIMVPFLSVFAVYWLLKALRTGKISSAVLGGLAAGLGFHTYIAFRFMPFVFAAPIVTALWQWRTSRTSRLAPNTCVPCVVALFLFITLVAALPMGLYFLQHPADFFGRTGQVSIFSAESPLAELGKSTALTLGMFSVRGDCNARHNLNCQPQLYWPVGILFLIGLAITIRDLFRRPLSPIPYVLFAWFLFLMLPATLTREGLPHALRAIGLIPPVMIFAGLGAARLWQAAEGYFSRATENPKYTRAQRQIGRIRAELAIAAALILAAVAGATGRDYFIRFANSAATYNAFAVDLWHQGQYLAALPDGIQKFVIVNLSGDDIRGVPAPAQTIMFATGTFGETERLRRRIRYVRRLEDITLDGAGRIAIIPMNGLEKGLTSRIRERFPGLPPRIRGDFMVFEN